MMDAPILLAFVLTGIYLFPWLVALGRSHPHKASIFVVNLFLGWTLLVWVLVFAWALMPLCPCDKETARG